MRDYQLEFREIMGQVEEYYTDAIEIATLYHIMTSQVVARIPHLKIDGIEGWCYSKSDGERVFGPLPTR